MIAIRFLNASVLLRKALNRNLSWGFPLGNLLPKTRVLKHRVLERKRRPNANASVLGTQRFRTLRLCPLPQFSATSLFFGLLFMRPGNVSWAPDFAFFVLSVRSRRNLVTCFGPPIEFLRAGNRAPEKGWQRQIWAIQDTIRGIKNDWT